MVIDLNDLREKDESLSVEKDWDERELKLHNSVSLLRCPVHSAAEISLSGGTGLSCRSVGSRLGADLLSMLEPFCEVLSEEF